jgi:hypothetical protein
MTTRTVRKPIRQPVTRMGWASFYIKRYCRYQTLQAEHLAMWYLILHEAFEVTA